MLYRRILLLVLAAIGGRVSAVAQPLRPERLPAAEAGLAGSFVMDVAVDGDGFLWIGSQRGVDRWDGVRLVSDERPSDVRRIAAGRVGLWAGGSGVAYRPDAVGSAWRTLRDARPDGPLASGVRALLPDGRGGAWVGTAGHGLVHAVPARRRYGRVLGLPSDSIRALVRPRRAPAWLWVGTPAGLTHVDAATGRAAGTWWPGGDSTAVVACTDAGAVVWCATRAGNLHALDVATGRALRSVAAGGPVSALVVSRARPGSLWIGTRGAGLRVLTLAGEVVPAVVGAGALARAEVMGLAEGADGVLWIGTLVGLYRADVRPLALAASAVLPGAPPVSALYEPPRAPGTLWLGILNGGLHHLERARGRRTAWTDAPGVPDVLFAIHEDSRRRLWLGGPGAALSRFDPQTGRAERVVLDARPGAAVFSVREDAARPGRLWVSTQAAGLIEFDADLRRVVRQWAPGGRGRYAFGGEVVWATAEAVGQPGVRWLATYGAGLMRLDVASGRLRPAPTTGGCVLGTNVNAIAPAPDGALWLGVERRAVVRYEPRTGACRAFPLDDGQPAEGYAVALDPLGRVWVALRARGVVALDPARGTQTRFSTADGLPSDETFIPAHARTAAGEWLLGGPGGWAALPLERLARGRHAPHVAVTRLRVDGRDVTLPGGSAPLVLRHDQNDVAVEFAALDLRQPEANRYRVRLGHDGKAGAWTALGAQADTRFPFLAPGRYTLRVAGAGPAGVWAEARPLALVVQPPLWRRWWVRLLAALAAVAAVAGLYQVRIRQMRRLETTRRRIADDLHDDIGSKVSTVALRLDLARRDPALAPETRQHLADLAGAARGVVTDLRDVVWLVDAGHDSLADLVDRIEIATAQMCAARAHAVDRPAALPDVSLSMERRRHVFLWVREALHNTCAHGCGTVRVRVTADGGHLRVAVEDEGPGFDPRDVGRGRGLSTLRTRAEALGGQGAVESAPGGPTRAWLLVPLR